MNLTESLELKRATLEAIPAEMVKSPGSIAVNTLVQKAEKLYVACVNDRQQLEANGVNWATVEDLPVRNRALLQANTLWHQQQSAGDSVMVQWVQACANGHKLFDQLVHAFRFAFSNDEGLTRRVKEIAASTTHADMIAHLNDLSEMGFTQSALLAVVNFDMSLLALAKQKADELTRLWADATVMRKQENEDKNLRDRAYTHLMEAVDYARKYGKYVFRFEPQRLKLYYWFTTRRDKKVEEPVAVVTPKAA